MTGTMQINFFEVGVFNEEREDFSRYFWNRKSSASHVLKPIDLRGFDNVSLFKEGDQIRGRFVGDLVG